MFVVNATLIRICLGCHHTPSLEEMGFATFERDDCGQPNFYEDRLGVSPPPSLEEMETTTSTHPTPKQILRKSKEYLQKIMDKSVLGNP